MAQNDIIVLQEQANGSLKEVLLTSSLLGTYSGAQGSMTLFHSNYGPTAAPQTVYMAFPFDLAPVASPERRLFQFPYNCVIKHALVTVNIGQGTLAAGQSGTSTVSLYNHTLSQATLLASGIDYTLLTSNTLVNNLNVSVTNNTHLYSIQVVTPAFTTAPSVVRRNVILWFTAL